MSADPSNFNFRKNRGIVLAGALLLLLATANDVVGAVTGLVSWAQTEKGKAILLVGVALMAVFLLLDRFISKD